MQIILVTVMSVHDLLRKYAYRDIHYTPLEFTQNKQQYGTEVTCTEVRDK